ncbi:MAG: nucleotidyltransferase family protein [Nanoarchaeota archaeon]
MTYTEIRSINGNKYYYRVISIREKNKVSKRRVYLGNNLLKSDLSQKEKEADTKLLRNKPNKEVQKIKSKIVGILKENNVKRAGIFGSYSRGEQKKESDIDIVVEIKDKNMTLLGFIGLKFELEDILRKKVDLVEYVALKPSIKNNILNEEVRIL